MNDLLGRVLVAALLAPVALACVWFGGVAMLLLALLAAALALDESSAWRGDCGRSR